MAPAPREVGGAAAIAEPAPAGPDAGGGAAPDGTTSVPGTRWWVEVGAAASVAVAYLSSPRSAPSTELIAEAERNAAGVLALEERLGLDVEAAVQSAALGLGLPTALNWLYGTLHFLVTAVVLVHLFRCRPGRYQCWRGGFVASSLLAFAIYRLWPVAPPRLLPDGTGSTVLVDTLAEHPTLWDFQSGPMSEVANHYAAMPSMHAGWALFCALALGLGRSGATRIALLGYPLLTTMVIMATGNHFLLDAVAGFAVVGVGLGAAHVVEVVLGRRAARDVAGYAPARLPGGGPQGVWGGRTATRRTGVLRTGRPFRDAA